jgi:uncharacterized protein YbaA (DUF1428 family)
MHYVDGFVLAVPKKNIPAYRSRAHRDRVNAKAMKDPRLAKMMDAKAMPFDEKRMTYGGLKVRYNRKSWMR